MSGFIDIFDTVVNAANANPRTQPRDGDYLNDEGLLMCGRCNTPKQVRVTIFDRVITPYCLCECAAREYDEEHADAERRERMERIRGRRKEAFPVASMMDWTFSHDDGANAKTTAIGMRYVDRFAEIRRREDNNGLLLYGGVGTGKTYLAACIVNALIDKGYTAKMTNLSRLANVIGGTYDGKQEIIDALNDYDLLVIDDLSAERETDYMTEIVFNVIDTRAAARKPLIITTNLTAELLKNPENEKKRRIYSRILERCFPVEVSGADRRREKLKQNYNDISEILGIN